jgi:hypothetical protein
VRGAEDSERFAGAGRHALTLVRASPLVLSDAAPSCVDPGRGVMTVTFNQGGREVSRGEGGRFDIAAAVTEFHNAFNLPMRQLPGAEIDHALARLRVALLEEEVSEFVAASEKGDLIGITDALADIVYVAYGTALIRSDGKVLKSEHYFPPDIEAVLSRQGR